MQRIESGSLRGRKLLPLPQGVPGLRPTAARIRGAIFDRLQHEIVGARVLDLFAGSGALSIEALSRGARWSTLLEYDARVVAHLRRQLQTLELSSCTEVLQVDTQRWLGTKCASDANFDLVFVDPPFAMPDVFEPIAQSLCAGGWLASDAWVVCERERVRGKSPIIAWPTALSLERSRDYGQARLELLRHRIPHPDPGATS